MENHKIIQHLDILATELWSASITENMLNILEATAAEVELSEADEIAASIKAAYCSVAVECTLKYIQLELLHSEYLNCVDRIWNVRIGALPSSSILFSEELRRWKQEIHASVSNNEIKKKLASDKLCSRFEAFVKLKHYLKRASKRFDPGGEVSDIGIVGDETDDAQDLADGSFLSAPGIDTVVVFPKNNAKVVKGGEEAEPLVSLKNDVSLKGKFAVTAAAVENAGEVSDIGIVGDEIDDAQDVADGSFLSAPGIDTVVVYPKNNAKLVEGGEEEELLVGLKNVSLKGKFAVTAGAEDANLQIASTDEDLHLPSYCRFYDEASSSAANALLGASDAPKFHLPSPKKKRILPLQEYEQKQITKRKKNCTWTKAEEEALEAGVARIGEGYWREILGAYPVLMNRTGVNLKDKWRNMQQAKKKLGSISYLGI